MIIYIKFGVNRSISLASRIFYSQRGVTPLNPPLGGQEGEFFFLNERGLDHYYIYKI